MRADVRCSQFSLVSVQHDVASGTYRVLQDGRPMPAVQPANVVVQRVQIRRTEYKDVLGLPTPYTVTVGSGATTVLRDDVASSQARRPAAHDLPSPPASVTTSALGCRRRSAVYGAPMEELPSHEIVRRARDKERSSPGGRLPLPDYIDWPTYPYEGELRVRPVADVVLPEPARSGAGGVDCFACGRDDDSYVWTNADWRVTSTKEPTGLPVVLLLEPRVHADLHDLPPELVAQLGTMLWRIEAALTSLGGVGRVQMARWGDGAEHLHWWFFVRPLGLAQARGSFLADWDDILPPPPREEWAADLRRVAAALEDSEPAEFGGCVG